MAGFDKESLLLLWEKRSKLEKRLSVLILILSIILIIVILCSLLSDRDHTCLSVECVTAASHILDYIDPSVRPCENFHQFMCGSYLKKAREYNKLSITRSLKERTKNQIESLISDDPDETTTNSLKLQRIFYRSCINTTALEANEDDTFLSYLDAIGGWPVIKGKFWDENIFDWKVTMIKARKQGLSFQKLLGLNIEYIKENITALKIMPPYDVHSVSHIMEPYVEVIRDIAIYLHSPSIGINSELRLIVNFQNDLHRIISKTKERKDDDKIMHIYELQDKFPRISWLQFLNNLLSGAAVLKDTDFVLITSEQYLIDLEVLLLKTSKRVQANYIFWKIVEKFIPFLTKDIRDRYHQFERQYIDNKARKTTREEDCIELSKELFADVAEIEYVRKYTDHEIRNTVLRIFEKVKEKLLWRLKSSSRMNVQLEEDIEEEMMNTTIMIGGSDDIFDVEKTEDHLGYNNMAFSHKDLVKMVTKLYINRVDHLFSNIGNTEDHETSVIYMPHISVNAFYMISRNLLILSTPLLQDIFYNKNRPNYMNFGSLVTVIGHEFAHSLAKLGNTTTEDEGRITYMHHTAFKNELQPFSECFQNQYKHFQDAESENKKSNTSTKENYILEENIADFVGTDIGYELYQEYIEEHGIERKLPGVNFTANQVFWIMAGTFLCETHATEKRNDFHADSFYRINYRMRNLPQFARDFNCPVGSFMNPEEKCKFF